MFTLSNDIRARLEQYCEENGIVKLQLFGSLANGKEGPDSDVDLLVKFAPDRISGLFRVSDMQEELSPLFGGKPVDLRTLNDLSWRFRDEVAAAAQLLYHASPT